MRTLAGWLLMVWLVSVGNGPAQAQSLPLSARADLLAQEIYTAVKHKQNALALEKIAAYRALEAEGHKTPPAVLFMEARLADKSNDPERSLKALEAYLAVAERSDRHYRDALTLHGKVKDQVERVISEETRVKEAAASKACERRKQDAQASIPDVVRTLQKDMVSISAGSFKMGGRNHHSEQPVHKVHVPGFRMSRYEVTVAQYDAFASDTELMCAGSGARWWYSEKIRNDHPVSITWDEAQAFTQWLSRKTGLRFRLPSEAEWEYACRGGKDREEYCGGDDPGAVAWYSGNSDGEPQPVGLKRPNRFGLFDMSGNAAEWVEDCWLYSYENAPTDGSAVRIGDERCEWGVWAHQIRGGSVDSDAEYLRSANRLVGNKSGPVGLRLASDL